MQLKGESIAVGAAYSGETFKNQAQAVLSSSKELVLFQCMSHLALMLYLWLRGWALARTQDAVQPIDCPGTEREREGDKSRAIVD